MYYYNNRCLILNDLNHSSLIKLNVYSSHMSLKIKCFSI